MKRIFVQFLNKNDFVIVFQSHIGNEFGNKEYSFATKDFYLTSSACPQSCPDMCYVRGDSEKRNTEILDVLSEEWKKRFIKCINDYNEYFK